MVQREIADRLRASPGSKVYGAPSVTVQLACSVELVRAIDPAVFRPRPRVDSALIRLERTGPGAGGALRPWCAAGSRTAARHWPARSSSAGVAKRGASGRGARADRA